MKRNPIIPYILIMVFGIVLVFALSFKGLGDAKEMAKDKGGKQTEATTQTASAQTPDQIYKQTCIACHGDQYQGVVGPSLKGIGQKLSKAQIEDIVTHGKGNMPPNQVSAEMAPKMADWLISATK
ncbi:MAG: cytochrome c [Bacillota bacterium]|nr:cytochrome c [Bacillota bacterium]